MWIATVDFQKAFDTIRHKALWIALAQIGMEPHGNQHLEETTCRPESDSLHRQRERRVRDEEGERSKVTH